MASTLGEEEDAAVAEVLDDANAGFDEFGADATPQPGIVGVMTRREPQRKTDVGRRMKGRS